MARRSLLVAALGGTLVASAWLALQPEAASEVVVPRRATLPTAASAAPALTTAARRDWPEPRPQALLAWGPPPAPAPPPATATVAAPVRPPEFPYRWIGRLDDGDVAQALLSGPQRSIGARAGDVLDGRWRIDRVAGDRIELTWLPTGDSVAVVYPP